jgi:hypothetical protein
MSYTSMREELSLLDILMVILLFKAYTQQIQVFLTRVRVEVEWWRFKAAYDAFPLSLRQSSSDMFRIYNS